MPLLYWERYRLKLGRIPLFRERFSKGKLVYYLLEIPVWRKTTLISKIRGKLKENKNFDTRELDAELEAAAPSVTAPANDLHANRVALLATELYDAGGHGKCLRDLMDVLQTKYTQTLFLTSYSSSCKKAPRIVSDIQKYGSIKGYDILRFNYNKKIKEVFYDICDFAPKVLFVWMQPDDAYGTILLSLIKRYTKIKIFYCPHSSHTPNLGISFADLVLEGMPVTAYITQKLRKCSKTYLLGMISKKLEKFPRFSEEEVLACRRRLGVKDSELCTMSGGGNYKFFDAPGVSEYFQTIKCLLERNLNVRHVILANFSKAERKTIETIFDHSEGRNRLVLLPTTPDYELVFSCADVFLDSFPISAALTMIDLMRLEVPAVVKINRENALWSFHEYQRPGSPFMFESAEGFLEGAESLLASKNLREKEIEENYRFYLERYEGNACRARLCELIEHADHLEPYYTVLPPETSYHFKGITQ